MRTRHMSNAADFSACHALALLVHEDHRGTPAQRSRWRDEVIVYFNRVRPILKNRK